MDDRSSTANPPKAWTSAKNPITGRSQTPQASFNSQNKQSSVTSSLREGQRVRITLATGAEFEGTYASGPDAVTCRLNMVQQKKLPNSAEITNGAGRKEQSNMSFQRKEIVEARVVSGNPGRTDGKAPNGSRSSFRTDAAISNSRPGADRALKPWIPDSVGEVDMSLERSANTGTWDQFAENERLFGLKTDYDESIYTTTIDKSHPQYKDRMAAADRKAREIERSTAATAHVAEERIMDNVGGDDRDEEENGVRRQDAPPLGSRENVYMPPARRAPTGHATVKGAPVDPAIISSQLKAAPVAVPASAPASKQGKADEIKTSGPGAKSSTTQSPGSKDAESKPEPKADGKTAEAKAKDAEGKPDAKAAETKSNDKNNGTANKPSAAISRTISPLVKETVAPSATSTVERDVYLHFKNFASGERKNVEKSRTNKARVDKQDKLSELKKFADSFKLTTPVPTDLISIIAKDPAKQKLIQEKALQDAKQKAAEAAAVQKEKEASSSKDTSTKSTTDQTTTMSSATPADTRSSSRTTAPTQHSNSPSAVPARHPGARASYNNPQSHYQQYNRNNRPAPHLASQNQPTGNLAQRLRNVEQQKMQHPPHMAQHPPVQDMRLPPTGPANNGDPSFGRRVSGPFLTPKLNPNSHEFRPNAFAQPFNPAVPSQSSSPRSSVNNIVVETVLPPIPVAGQLIRRKTKAVDIKKCFILSHIETIQPPAGRNWDENDGLRPSFDTLPTWRQLQEETEKPDSTMHLTYNQYFERLPVSSAAIATPNPSHALPQIAHQHQLPLHLQHGSHNAPRQSPHMPPMQMHVGQHGHVAHVPFSAPDDHRMMHSNSAQSFASPRMGHVPMAYPPAMNAPVQMAYNQQVMQPYMNPGAPQMSYRSFSGNPQFMQQQPHHMGAPMMVQNPQMIAPNGMPVAGGPQLQMYPSAHPQFLPPNAVQAQPMAGSNGSFPSPGRPAATMMAHQGSHQGQAPVYGMSPGMHYQQPYTPQQQPQGKFSGQRPQ
ncbi:hypothetical protein B0T19DRAFT_260357 [Cercophora scortea]|uniref:LsmAD domain-containing protein n=1 Tax=Cercophora scortea TaxID=314031 RepID=A0AAE0I9S3_9PEZI|nr:hypothetical protein B0T19DRAFT_260357 [Cercophora scortea]